MINNNSNPKLKERIKNFLKRFDKITVKLVPTYFLVMIITLALFSYYILNSISTYLYNEERVNASTTANIISSFAMDYIDDGGKTVDAEFDNLMSALNLNSQMRVYIINKDGIVIFDSLKSRSVLGKAQIKQSVITALGGKNGFETYNNSDGIKTIDMAVPILKNTSIIGAVNVVHTADNVSAFTDAIENDLLLLAAAISLLVGLVIFIVSAFMTRRIVDFTNKITSMSSDGILDEKLDINGNDEIARLGEAFNNLSDKILKLEQQRVEFVSNASHELKTPLSAIKLMADSIIQTPDIDMDYVREFLGDMNDEVDRLNRIVTKLLYITKMDTNSDKISHNMELVSIRDILNGIEKNLMPIAKRDEIALKFFVDGDIYVKANKDTLWQGIYNIVDNAIKYSKEFGEVDVTLSHNITDVIITVKDNGVGISEENISKIFDRFYRVDKARSRETGGTGLGLSIALSAIKIHGGDIKVESEPNIGSTFTITLPMAAQPVVFDDDTDGADNKKSIGGNAL